jgi:hypothetical protein
LKRKQCSATAAQISSGLKRNGSANLVRLEAQRQRNGSANLVRLEAQAMQGREFPKKLGSRGEIFQTAGEILGSKIPQHRVKFLGKPQGQSQLFAPPGGNQFA